MRSEVDGKNVYLVVVDGDLRHKARTSNQLGAADGVMNSLSTSDASLNRVFDAMEKMTDDGRRAALDQLGGEVFGSAAAVGLQRTSNWLGSVGNRLRPSGIEYPSPALAAVDGSSRDRIADRPVGGALLQLVSYDPAFGFSSPSTDIDLPLVVRRAPQSYNGWTGGYGTAGDASGDGNSQGLSYRFAGTSFGVDRQFGDGTIFGLAGGYADSRVRTDNRLQQADVNSYQAALYGSRVGERYYAFNVLSYGFNDYKTLRRLPVNLTARGDYAGDEVSDYLETGMSLYDDIWTWQPSLNLQYIGLRQHAFNETGAGGAGLAVGSHFDHSLRVGGGLRVVSPFHVGRVTLVPDSHVRYAFEVLDAERLVTANFSGVAGGAFTTAGNRLGRHFGQAGLALNAVFNRHISSFSGYDLMSADYSVAHAGNVGLQLLW